MTVVTGFALIFNPAFTFPSLIRQRIKPLRSVLAAARGHDFLLIPKRDRSRFSSPLEPSFSWPRPLISRLAKCFRPNGLPTLLSAPLMQRCARRSPPKLAISNRPLILGPMKELG